MSVAADTTDKVCSAIAAGFGLVTSIHAYDVTWECVTQLAQYLDAVKHVERSAVDMPLAIAILRVRVLAFGAKYALGSGRHFT